MCLPVYVFVFFLCACCAFVCICRVDLSLVSRIMNLYLLIYYRDYPLACSLASVCFVCLFLLTISWNISELCCHCGCFLYLCLSPEQRIKSTSPDLHEIPLFRSPFKPDHRNPIYFGEQQWQKSYITFDSNFPNHSWEKRLMAHTFLYTCFYLSVFLSRLSFLSFLYLFLFLFLLLHLLLPSALILQLFLLLSSAFWFV